MADDWKVGDLALCVDDSPARRVAGHRGNSDPVSLVRGRLYTVLFVGPDVYGKGFVGLAVTCTAWGWFADRFVKVTPPEADEFDRETIALLSGEQVPA
jgi:hypothetical protein